MAMQRPAGPVVLMVQASEMKVVVGLASSAVNFLALLLLLGKAAVQTL
jgi:hypothetical protein